MPIFHYPLSPTLRLTTPYTYYPGTPDVFYLPNGDPGYPGDPPELDYGPVHLEALQGGGWVVASPPLFEPVLDIAWLEEQLYADAVREAEAADYAQSLEDFS
jgi:hypothetical protein